MSFDLPDKYDYTRGPDDSGITTYKTPSCPLCWICGEEMDEDHEDGSFEYHDRWYCEMCGKEEGLI